MLSDLIDDLMHEADVEAAPEWRGLPLNFRTAYAHPDQLDDAFDRFQFEHGTLASNLRSHMWHRAVTGGRLELEAHDLHQYTADTRCAWYHHGKNDNGERIPCACVGDLLTMTLCTKCRWSRIDTEDAAVRAWHDHAFPGWRELPTFPAKLRTGGGAKLTPHVQAWIDENYPPQFRAAGAPIITERQKYGTRAVPGYSPLGGYDIAARAGDE